MRYKEQPLQPRHHGQHRHIGRHRQGGFLLLDIVLGCMLLAVIFAAMLGSAHLYSQGQKKMDSRRAATRLAETVLTDLQRGEKTLPVEGVKITPLKERSAAGLADDGMVWCEVNATANDIEVSLIGQVPRASLNAKEADTPGQVNTPRQLQEVMP